MKALVFVFLMSIYSMLNGLAQNRIHGWDTEKITSARIELTSPDDKTEVQTFNAKKDLDAIISFLKDVDFRELDGHSIDTEAEANYWRCRIIFQGQRDQVYLNKGSACIGKTSFIIDKNVIDDFRILVKKLLTKAKVS